MKTTLLESIGTGWFVAEMTLKLTLAAQIKFKTAQGNLQLTNQSLCDKLNELLCPKPGKGWHTKKRERVLNGKTFITNTEAEMLCTILKIDFDLHDFQQKLYSPQSLPANSLQGSILSAIELTSPPDFGFSKHSAENTDIIKPVAIDVWIEDAKKEVISKFEENKKSNELSNLASLKVKLNQDNNERNISSKYLNNIAISQSSQMLLIWGEAGSGKSTIAFQIARWGFEKKFSEYSILPILLEPLSDTETVTDQICKFFINVTSYTRETLSENFINMLVSHKRLLIIVDQFSDLTADQKKRLQDTLPPKCLLLITSRNDESDRFRVFKINTIQPKRLIKEDFSYFIEEFLREKKQCQYPNEEVESLFSKIVGNLAITPLLATKTLEKILEYLNNLYNFKSNQAFCVKNDKLPSINLKELLEEYIMCIYNNSFHNAASLCNEIQALFSECSSNATQVNLTIVHDSDDSRSLYLKVHNYKFVVNIIMRNKNCSNNLDLLFFLLYALWLVSDKIETDKFLASKEENTAQIFFPHIRNLIYFASITRFNDLPDPVCRAEWLDIAGRSAIGNELSPEILNALSKIVEMSEDTTNYSKCNDVIELIDLVIQKNKHQLCHSLFQLFLQFTVDLIDRVHNDNHYVQVTRQAIRSLGFLGTDASVDKLLEIVNQECYSFELRIEAIRSFVLIEDIDFSIRRLNDYFLSLIRRKNNFSLNEIRLPAPACSFYLLTAVSRTLQRLSYSKIPQWGRPEGLRIPMLCLESDYKNDSCNLSLQEIEPEVWHLPLPNEQKIEVICINADFYTLGSPEQEAFRDTVYGTKHVASSDHIECIRTVEMHKFLISRNPVTHAQFKSLVEGMVFPALQSPFDDDNFPIVNLSSKEAIEWCKIFTKFLHSKFTLYENESVSLPTRDQWEIACRAGSSHAYHFGRDLLPEYSNFNPDSYSNENRSEKHKYQPIESGHFGVSNNWGISDMHGNVFEWCLNPKSDTTAIARGGSFRTASAYCRSAYQKKIERIDYTENDIGFRVCVRIFK
jgi:formylglycine-generating enzyme required for sulfatase activity